MISFSSTNYINYLQLLVFYTDNLRYCEILFSYLRQYMNEANNSAKNISLFQTRFRYVFGTPFLINDFNSELGFSGRLTLLTKKLSHFNNQSIYCGLLSWKIDLFIIQANFLRVQVEYHVTTTDYLVAHTF